MIEYSLPNTVPKPSSELQNRGRTDQPQNQPSVQDVEVNIVKSAADAQKKTDDFEQYLNSSQNLTVLTNQKSQSPIFDPVADITENSALQGYGSLGQNQPT